MKKRILIIPSWYPNSDNFLIGSFFHEQAALMHSNGYDVKVLRGNVIHCTTIAFYLRQVKYFVLKKQMLLSNSFLVQSPDAFSFPILQIKEGSERQNFERCGNSYLKALKVLKDDGWEPDLIHAQCAADGGTIADFIRKATGIPYVLVEHQVFLLNKYSVFKQDLIKKSFKNALKVAAVSYHQKRCILMHEIDVNIDVIWNFVNEDQFVIKKTQENKKFTIIAVTYPDHIKDVETLFRSIATFSGMVSDDFEVIIIGNNSFHNINAANTAIFEDLAERYKIKSKCILIPFVLRAEISRYLNTADVFVSTSIAETFGVAVREAMLCGVPIITTKSGGVEDSITSDTGVTVNIGDDLAIAQSLLKIKERTLVYDAETIRNFVISQCGSDCFLKNMNSFYN